MSFCFVLQFQKIHLSLIVHLHTKNQNGPSITAYQTILQSQLKVFRKKHFNSFWYMWSILTLHSKQFLLYSMISIIPRKTLITNSFFLVCLPLSEDQNDLLIRSGNIVDQGILKVDCLDAFWVITREQEFLEI